MAVVEAAKVTLPCNAACFAITHRDFVLLSSAAAALPFVHAPCATAADCSKLLTRPLLFLQERIRGQSDIRDAASRGDIALVQDHLLADPACVNRVVGGW
jgi:hypothetical protein